MLVIVLQNFNPSNWCELEMGNDYGNFITRCSHFAVVMQIIYYLYWAKIGTCTAQLKHFEELLIQ